MECIICILMITVVLISLQRFTVGITNTLIKTADTASVVMDEYYDVLQIRGSGNSESLNKPDQFTLIESDGTFQLWRYQGEYITFYKVVEG